MKTLITRITLWLLLSSSALFAEVPEGFLLRNQLEASQLRLRHLNALLTDMVESEIDEYYVIAESGLIVTRERLTSDLVELLKHASIELSEAERETVAAQRVRDWKHKLTRKVVRGEIELTRNAIAGFEAQLRRVAGE